MRAACAGQAGTSIERTPSVCMDSFESLRVVPSRADFECPFPSLLLWADSWPAHFDQFMVVRAVNVMMVSYFHKT